METNALTPEQQRLYDRLVEHCAKEHMWCGNAAQLAAFADLAYPFDPGIVYALVERKLIRHHCISSYALTVERER